MMVRLALRAAALLVCFWIDVFLLPALGGPPWLWTTAAALGFAARGLPDAAAGLLGFFCGALFASVSTLPPLAVVAAGTLAGVLPAHLSRLYLSQRSLLSLAATAAVCAAAFWSPTLARAAADAVRGADPGAFIGAGGAVLAQAAVAAAFAFPFLLLRRAADTRVRRT